MAKIIYIAGLGHSGSTMLDMSLGTLPEVVGLGELKTLLDDTTRMRHFSSVCSCGKPAIECSFWKELPQLLKPGLSLANKYEIVLNLLQEKYGKTVCLIDSSKNSYNYLSYLKENHELKILFLTRDIRSWSYARYLSTGKPVLYYLFRWYIENIKLKKRIKKMGIDIIKIGYEELALYPEHVLEKITSGINLNYTDSVLHPENSNSHIISGNIARVDALKRRNWFYDARWMLSKRIMFYGPLFLLFQRKNKSYVYSNISGSSQKEFYMFGTIRKNHLSEKYN